MQCSRYHTVGQWRVAIQMLNCRICVLGLHLYGSAGMLRLHICVDCILALFGSNTVIPVVVCLELTMGMELKK